MGWMDSQQQPALWLDLDAERLWRGTEALRLRPKSFAVLRQLVAQAGRVVPRKELVQVVWLDTTVSNGVLVVCMNELRTVLGDAVQAPQYIETVPRRGYRWIGPCLTVAPPSLSVAPRLPHAASGPALVVG